MIPRSTRPKQPDFREETSTCVVSCAQIPRFPGSCGHWWQLPGFDQGKAAARGSFLWKLFLRFGTTNIS